MLGQITSVIPAVNLLELLAVTLSGESKTTPTNATVKNFRILFPLSSFTGFA
jgi:hypothetical protein